DISLLALVHGRAAEQLGRQEVDIYFTAAADVTTPASGIRRHHRRAVQQYAGEVGAHAADRDVHACAVDIAAGNVHARHARQCVGDVRLREFTHVLGEHGVGQTIVLTLFVGRQGQRTAEAGDGHEGGFFVLFLVLVVDLGLGGRRNGGLR